MSTYMSLRRMFAIGSLSVVTFAACAGDDTDDASADTPAAPDSVPATADPGATAPAASAPPTATATTAPAPPTATATTAPVPPTAVVAEREYDFSDVDRIVQQTVDRDGLNGASLIVVDRHDGVVHEQYWGEFDADRVSFVASSSKMVSAGVLMYLDDQGLLDVDAPVIDTVGWGRSNPEITSAQLVSNSSGLVGIFPDVTYGPYFCQYLTAGTITECAEQIFTTSDDDARVTPPDTRFDYGGGQWQVAGGVAEVVSGATWAELIDEIYVEPCGLDVFGYNNQISQFSSAASLDYPDEWDGDPGSLAPTDNPNIEAGLYTTAPDYAAVMLMHLRDGMCGDTRVLSSAALDALHADRIGPAYDGTTPAGGGYGMGWWVDRATGIISDSGAYGSYPWLDVDAGYGALLIVETDGSALGPQIVAPTIAAITAARTSAGE